MAVNDGVFPATATTYMCWSTRRSKYFLVSSMKKILNSITAHFWATTYFFQFANSTSTFFHSHIMGWSINKTSVVFLLQPLDGTGLNWYFFFANFRFTLRWKPGLCLIYRHNVRSKNAQDCRPVWWSICRTEVTYNPEIDVSRLCWFFLRVCVRCWLPPSATH